MFVPPLDIRTDIACCLTWCQTDCFVDSRNFECLNGKYMSSYPGDGPIGKGVKMLNQSFSV